MNAFGYLRVSSKGQVEGDGFDRQEAAIRKFGAAQGVIISFLFKEGGVSGTVEGLDRPEFSDLLRYVDERPVGVDAIVVERMDRLARDLMVSEVLLAECRKRGLKVYSADQEALIDMAAEGGDPTRVLIRQIMGALAQWEKSMLVSKLRASRLRVRASGRRCEGAKPFGSRPAEMVVLRFIDILQADGCSYGSIAGMLNADGHTLRNGGAWTKQNVRRLILRRKGGK